MLPQQMTFQRQLTRILTFALIASQPFGAIAVVQFEMRIENVLAADHAKTAYGTGFA
jgi:hypothetical protein